MSLGLGITQEATDGCLFQDKGEFETSSWSGEESKGGGRGTKEQTLMVKEGEYLGGGKQDAMHNPQTNR